ncbi:MAG: hypothetical protein CM15mP83_2110 [Flavobacteriaceae bacterium]|nr:MAG: hypothetical protein CM15mP83_2110 [Flavobacteriaceae bacterium]
MDGSKDTINIHKTRDVIKWQLKHQKTDSQIEDVGYQQKNKYAEKKVLVVGTIAFDEVETPSGSSGKVIAGSATYISLATLF